MPTIRSSLSAVIRSMPCGSCAGARSVRRRAASAAIFRVAHDCRVGRCIDAAGREAPVSHAPPIRPIPRDEPLPASFAQQRLWVLDQLEPDSRAYNLSSAFCLEGLLDVTAFRARPPALVTRHEVFRTTFVHRDGRPLQVISPKPPLALRMVDLRVIPDGEREGKRSDGPRSSAVAFRSRPRPALAGGAVPAG